MIQASRPRSALARGPSRSVSDKRRGGAGENTASATKLRGGAGAVCAHLVPIDQVGRAKSAPQLESYVSFIISGIEKTTAMTGRGCLAVSMVKPVSSISRQISLSPDLRSTATDSP